MGPLARLLLAIAGISAIGLGLASVTYVPPKTVSIYEILTIKLAIPNYTYFTSIQPIYVIDNYTTFPARIKSALFTSFAIQLWNQTVYISSSEPVKLIVYQPLGMRELQALRATQRVIVLNGTVEILAPAAVVAIYPGLFELIIHT